MKYRVSTERLTWRKAKVACEKIDAKLATLLSDAEFEEVGKLMKDQEYYWIGGVCSGNSYVATTRTWEILVFMRNWFHSQGCKTLDVKDDRWRWLSGEKIEPNSPFWAKDCTLANDPNGGLGLRKFLILFRDGNDVMFKNHGENSRLNFICQNKCGDDGKRQGVLFKWVLTSLYKSHKANSASSWWQHCMKNTK